jgi:hypothetical protein
MEAKVDEFTRTFTRWQELVGFNWYHAGKKKAVGAMSDEMVRTITAARRGTKPFGSG